MPTYTTARPVADTQTQVLAFVKDQGIWYADLPEFLEARLGTRANLMMVDGADTFLDHQLWLCPVTEYVFGNYPNEIYTAIR